jgi:hypothetical protein
MCDSSQSWVNASMGSQVLEEDIQAEIMAILLPTQPDYYVHSPLLNLGEPGPQS